jgi:hypothetical protein
MDRLSGFSGNYSKMKPCLFPRQTPDAEVQNLPGGWRLSIPAGPANAYRLAQLDDYQRLPRRHFAWQPPINITLRARASAPNLPGTWGFGLWNDPFGISLGFGGHPFRLPCLPNAAWFFHASPENHLSFHNDQPAQGFLAQVFRSPRWPSWGLIPALIGTPLLVIRSLSRLARRIASILIREQGITCSAPCAARDLPEPISLDVTQWHRYSLEWSPSRVVFGIDDTPLLVTSIVPQPPLGLVIWIDNQYAAWQPDGRFKFGVLENPAAWIEIEDLVVKGSGPPTS